MKRHASRRDRAESKRHKHTHTTYCDTHIHMYVYIYLYIHRRHQIKKMAPHKKVERERETSLKAWTAVSAHFSFGGRFFQETRNGGILAYQDIWCDLAQCHSDRSLIHRGHEQSYRTHTDTRSHLRYKFHAFVVDPDTRNAGA